LSRSARADVQTPAARTSTPVDGHCGAGVHLHADDLPARTAGAGSHRRPRADVESDQPIRDSHAEPAGRQPHADHHAESQLHAESQPQPIGFTVGCTDLAVSDATTVTPDRTVPTQDRQIRPHRYAGTRADQLSGGTLAKLNLGLALLADPDLLLLDEPYAGFDWDTYLRFWTLVAERRTAGRTVLIISHIVVDEDRFDRIIDIRDGKAVPR
jgi:hypothetical protein